MSQRRQQGNQPPVQKKKFSLCAFLCCSKAAAARVNDADQLQNNRVQQRPGQRRNGRPRDSESPSSSDEEQKQHRPAVPPKKETNLQLITKHTEVDVKFVDLQPDVREERYRYKYYCPICLRYFTHMLQSACCQNYLCLMCAKDLQVKESKEEAFKASCPYKCTTPGSGAES